MMDSVEMRGELVTGRIAALIAVSTTVYTAPSAEGARINGKSLRATVTVELIPLKRVRLELLYEPGGVSHAMAKLRYPEGRVLSGTFFHQKTRSVAGLVKTEDYEHPPSGRTNRPAIGQLANQATGGLVFTTATKAKAELERLRVVVEVGPFLIANGQNWERFDVPDRSFYRPCSRLAVGRTKHHLIIARGFGQLRAFRSAIRRSVRLQTKETIEVLANIDGGTSAGRQKLPVRAVFLTLPRPSPGEVTARVE